MVRQTTISLTKGDLMTQKQIIALGFFDGVHLGHCALLRECRRLADQLGCAAAALTFETHPEALVCGHAPRLLNTAGDRQRLLLAAGMDRVIVLPFDRNMMTMPWQSFFRLLVSKYQAAGLVCGHDFRFGSRGAGTPELLRAACEKEGIPCTVIPEQKLEEITVSSTYIRTLVEAGELERAARFLGHPHIFTGFVVPGQHLGRTIGVPTANLCLPRDLAQPRRGVYACRALVDGESYLAVTNVGCRPTVGGDHVTVEPWILDFEGDLYGREITLEFHKFLRPEQRFDSLEALRQEIRKNAEETRAFFSGSSF